MNEFLRAFLLLGVLVCSCEILAFLGPAVVKQKVGAAADQRNPGHPNAVAPAKEGNPGHPNAVAPAKEGDVPTNPFISRVSKERYFECS